MFINTVEILASYLWFVIINHYSYINVTLQDQKVLGWHIISTRQKMKVNLPFFFTFLSKSFSLKASHFESENMSLQEWIASSKINLRERSAVECGLKCQRNSTCTAIVYDDASNSCTLIQRLKRSHGLKIAWSSSVLANKRHPSFAVDGNAWTGCFITKNNGDKYPWIAIDLLTEEKVTGVMLMERNNVYANRTKNIEVRVGNEKPFERNTNGNSVYTINKVCGLIDGPGIASGTTTLNCQIPIYGRYVTLQRMEGRATIINWMEVVVETETQTSTMMDMDISILTYIQRLAFLKPKCDNAVDYSQCPMDFPYAVRRGELCCSSAVSSVNFDSEDCTNGESNDCQNKPCVNFGCQPYSCYLQGMTLSGGDNLNLILNPNTTQKLGDT